MIKPERQGNHATKQVRGGQGVKCKADEISALANTSPATVQRRSKLESTVMVRANRRQHGRYAHKMSVCWMMNVDATYLAPRNLWIPDPRYAKLKRHHLSSALGSLNQEIECAWCS